MTRRGEVIFQACGNRDRCARDPSPDMGADVSSSITLDVQPVASNSLATGGVFVSPLPASYCASLSCTVVVETDDQLGLRRLPLAQAQESPIRSENARPVPGRACGYRCRHPPLLLLPSAGPRLRLSRDSIDPPGRPHKLYDQGTILIRLGCFNIGSIDNQS